MKSPWEFAASGTEYAHQVALFSWCNVAARFGLTAANDPKSYTVKGHAMQLYLQHRDNIPLLEWLHAIKNAGHGDAIRGARSAAEGVKPGVPDTSFPVPRNGFHGLYIELKRPDSLQAQTQIKKKSGVIGNNQDKWIEFLKSVGYKVVVSYGFEAAIAELLTYLRVANGNERLQKVQAA